MGPEEGILYADCNLELGIQMKLRHDFAGHYNRPDIFQLHINRAAPQLYHVHNAEFQQQIVAQAADRLAPPVARLPSGDTEPSE
jgi:aliphatic nitrilase